MFLADEEQLLASGRRIIDAARSEPAVPHVQKISSDSQASGLTTSVDEHLTDAMAT